MLGPAVTGAGEYFKFSRLDHLGHSVIILKLIEVAYALENRTKPGCG